MDLSWLWFVAVLGVPVVFLAILVFAKSKRRRQISHEADRRREAVDELYHSEDEPPRQTPPP